MGMSTDEGGWAVPSFTYTTSYGDTYTLGLYREEYLFGGMALGTTVIDGPDEEELLDYWDMVSVNIPDDPTSREWCEHDGCIVIDANNLSRELVDALVESGIVEMTGGLCHSGFCTYPLARVSDDALGRLRSYEETVAALEEQMGNPSLVEQAVLVGDPSFEQSRESSRVGRGER